MIDPNSVTPQWRTVRCDYLNADIQVRRPTVADAGIPIERSWIRLARSADGTPLLPANFDPTSADARLVEQIVGLAMEVPNPSRPVE
jgi:hypothetical protein